jgi:hypothetical protein
MKLMKKMIKSETTVKERKNEKAHVVMHYLHIHAMCMRKSFGFQTQRLRSGI